jgi:hypothetical protein
MSSFGSTDADQALLRSIADNIVQTEVIDVMENHKWQHGDPPALAPKADNPPEEAAPKPEAVAAAGTTPTPAPAPKGEAVADPSPDAIDWESLRGQDGKYAGKYTSKQELVKGVGNVVNMAKAAFTRAEALQKELDELRARPAVTATSPAPTPGVAQTAVADAKASLAAAPVKSDKLAKVLAKIAEEGGLLDAENLTALMDGISDQSNLQAASIVDAKLAARDSAQSQQNAIWDAVEAHMTKHYPRSADFVDEMGLYVKSHPVLQKAVHALSAQGDHIGATALAWETFERTLPPTSPAAAAEQAAAERMEVEGAAKEQVRKEAVEQARKDAGVPSTSVTGTHESVNVGPSADEIAAAAREMNATGIGTRWRSLAFGKDLTGPLFD